MESVDQQFRQLKENYTSMTEGELAAIAERAYDLTEIAREALQVVIMEKGVDIPIKMDPLALPPKDEDLVIFGWPRGAEAAGQSMKILAAAGIPSFLTLEVRPADVNRAHAALERAYEEMAKEENAKDDLEETDYAILCPQCHSAKVILQGRTSTLEANPFGIKVPVDLRCLWPSVGGRWHHAGTAGGQSWPGKEFSSRRGPFRRVNPKWASEP